MARKVTTLSRYEQIGSYPWRVNSITRLRKNTELDPARFLVGLLINVRATVTLGTANAAAVLADNVACIIESIRAFGKNQVRNTTDTFIQIRGCDMKELMNQFAGITVFDNSSTLAVGTGAYNLDFNIIIDFPPPNVRVEEQIGYLLDVPNWSNLEIDLQFGDANSLWNPSTTTFAWTNQVVNVLGRYAMEPGKFAGFGFGLRYLLGTEIAGSLLTTTATKQNLFQLDAKPKVRGLLLKTGVKATTTTAPNNAYATLSDSILANVNLIKAPNLMFRQYFRTTDLKAINAYGQKRNPVTGYAWLDFVLNGLSFEALNPTVLANGAANDMNLWIQADVAGAANQALMVVQDSLYYSQNIVIPTS